MRRRIIRSTEQRRYSLLVEYHELPPVFLRSLGYILELFSSPFQACSPPRQSSGLRVPVPCSACYRRYMLRKTVSTLICKHDFTHDVDHVRKSSLRFSFGRGQRSYAYVLRGRRESLGTRLCLHLNLVCAWRFRVHGWSVHCACAYGSRTSALYTRVEGVCQGRGLNIWSALLYSPPLSICFRRLCYRRASYTHSTYTWVPGKQVCRGC